ncbi:hypothetical protein EYF80_064126 [Liparis tanakae]|uniref:Uncharacterized protein n=1 Tax=Liparis tanakae TaxID=230148 RepID=A0A4Z2EBS5_9TELE|nr:hypothetical protein EYF80_064126 [Liparis tanakae]
MDVPSQGVIHRACHLIGQCAHQLQHYDRHLFELLRHRGYSSSAGPVAGFAEVAPTPKSTSYRTLLAEPLFSLLSAQAGISTQEAAEPGADEEHDLPPTMPPRGVMSYPGPMRHQWKKNNKPDQDDPDEIEFETTG